MNIHLISAALPPALDGIGDYSARIAVELAKTASVTVLTGQANPEAIPGVVVETVFSAAHPRSVWNIARRVAAEPPDWVLLQYNPFSYGRWGLNLHLPLVIRQIKRRCPGVRIAVMAHEKFVPFWDCWQFMIMTLWQRPQFALLAFDADVLLFSTEAWAEAFHAKYPRKPVLHLPVGSNIPRVPMSRAEARARLGISDETFVIGIFGTMHVTRLTDWMRNVAQEIADTGRPMLVLYIGPDVDMVRAILGDLPLRADGPLASAEVSRRFTAMDMHLTPFADGISTRRGSVMAGLQHGIATVGTLGYNTDRILRENNDLALLLAPVDEPEQFVAHSLRLMTEPELRKQIGREGRNLFEREFHGEQIAHRLFTFLENHAASR